MTARAAGLVPKREERALDFPSRRSCPDDLDQVICGCEGCERDLRHLPSRPVGIVAHDCRDRDGKRVAHAQQAQFASVWCGLTGCMLEIS